MKYRFQENKHKKAKPKSAHQTRLWIRMLQKSLALIMLFFALIILEPVTLYEELKSNLPDMSNFVKFELKEIKIEGNERISQEQLLKESEIRIHNNIFAVNLNEVKKNIEKNPWIWEATVQRILPSIIKITIEEEKVRAVFIKNLKTYFINHRGDIIEEVDDYNIARNYIYLIGENANSSYSTILDYLYNSDKIYSNIEGLIKINDRRWDIKLKNNITLKLPEANLFESLAIFDNILQKNNLLAHPCVIDLRILPDKIYIKF